MHVTDLSPHEEGVGMNSTAPAGSGATYSIPIPIPIPLSDSLPIVFSRYKSFQEDLSKLASKELFLYRPS